MARKQKILDADIVVNGSIRAFGGLSETGLARNISRLVRTTNRTTVVEAEIVVAEADIAELQEEVGVGLGSSDGSSFIPSTAPSIEAFTANGRLVVLKMTRPPLLAGARIEYELQIAEGISDWYSFGVLDGSDAGWIGELGAKTNLGTSSTQVISGLPLNGTTESPTSRTFLFRARVVSGSNYSLWSTSAEATIGPWSAGDLAAQAVSRAKLSAGFESEYAAALGDIDAIEVDVAAQFGIVRPQVGNLDDLASWFEQLATRADEQYIINEQDALAIRQDNEGTVSRVSAIEIRADGIDLTVAEIDTSIAGVNAQVAQIELDADSLTLTVSDLDTALGVTNGTVSQIQQTASSLALTVGTISTDLNTAESDIAQIEIDAGLIASRVLDIEDLTENYTTLEQTAESIRAAVFTSGTTGSRITTLEASVDSVTTTIADLIGVKWEASTAYVLTDMVNADGSSYECTTAGTSAATEPTWPGSGTVNDGTVVWTYAGSYVADLTQLQINSDNISSIVADGGYWDASDVFHPTLAFSTSIQNKARFENFISGGIGDAWAALTVYAAGDRVGVSNISYECTTGGTSGASAPTWPISGYVTDGTVEWIYVGGLSEAVLYQTVAGMSSFVSSAAYVSDQEDVAAAAAIMAQAKADAAEAAAILAAQAQADAAEADAIATASGDATDKAEAARLLAEANAAVAASVLADAARDAAIAAAAVDATDKVAVVSASQSLFEQTQGGFNIQTQELWGNTAPPSIKNREDYAAWVEEAFVATDSSILITQQSVLIEVQDRTELGVSLAASILVEADRITSEVSRASASEGVLASQIIQTSDAIKLAVWGATTIPEGDTIVDTMASQLVLLSDQISARVQARKWNAATSEYELQTEAFMSLSVALPVSLTEDRYAAVLATVALPDAITAVYEPGSVAVWDDAGIEGSEARYFVKAGLAQGLIDAAEAQLLAAGMLSSQFAVDADEILLNGSIKAKHMDIDSITAGVLTAVTATIVDATITNLKTTGVLTAEGGIDTTYIQIGNSQVTGLGSAALVDTTAFDASGAADLVPRYLGSFASAPTEKQTGDTYYNTATAALMAWNGTAWAQVAEATGAASSAAGAVPRYLGSFATSPTAGRTGDTYFDTSEGDKKMYAWSGTAWVQVTEAVGAAEAARIAAEAAADLAAQTDLAAKLGYASYSDMVAKVSDPTNFGTIISGGYIRATLIEADALKAKIATITDLTVTGEFSGKVDANEISIGNVTAGDNIVRSSLAQAATSGISPVKLKELQIAASGVVRVYFEIKRNPLITSVRGRIYVNGIAVGTERIGSSETYVGFDEDITVTAGDLVQIYAYAPIGSPLIVYIANFKIKIAQTPGILAFLGNP